MRYLSVCSGYGGAELAFEGLGWRCAGVAEIDHAARTVLKHRWPEVKNFGDFTKITTEDVGSIDALVGGTPCQSFSVAGLRGGLGDERGNLALEFLRLAHRTRPRWILWENVPGVFSATSHIAPDPCMPANDLDGNNGPPDGTEVMVEDQYDSDEDHAFSCFLAGLSELGYGYAYRTLDAQFFGVPQRRRRVFVVGYLGDWRPAAAVLFERHCLSGHPAPRREAREAVAGPVNASTPSRRNGGSNPTADQFISGTLGRGGSEAGATTSIEAGPSFPQNNSPGPYWDGSDTADTLDASNASNASKQQAMPEKRRFQAIITGSLNANGKAAGSATQQDAETGMLVTHALRADGVDASEDGTGRGTPLVASFNNTGAGWWKDSDKAQGLRSSSGGGSHEATIVAFDSKASGRNGFGVGENSPTLRSMSHADSHQNAGGQVAIAIQERAICENPDAGPDGAGIRTDDCAYTVESRQVPQAVAFESPATLATAEAHVPAVAFQSSQSGVREVEAHATLDSNNGSRRHNGVSQGMQVRRLTPQECERLQGLPDNHTLVPYHGKPMADGPRYRMIGNGFAVPVVRWIGERIRMVEELAK